MSGLAHLSRVSAAMFAFFGVLWFALPFLNALGGTYEGAPMLFVCFFFGLLSAIVGGICYGSYRYARREGQSQVVTSLLWCFVGLSGFLGTLFVLRVIWVVVEGRIE